MSIHIIRADLSQLPFYVDFIVNTANPEPKVGNGLDKYIHEKAGPEMLEMRKQIGQISPGDIAITNAFNLNAKSESVVTTVKKAFPVEECVTYQEACEVLSDEYTKNGIQTSPERIHASIKQSNYFRNRMQPKTFPELLQKFMDDKSITPAQIYEYIGMTRQGFSANLSGQKKPKKETVILFAMRLELSLQELEEQLEKAGHALSDDQEEDRLTKEFFASQCYDIYRYYDERAELGFSIPKWVTE